MVRRRPATDAPEQLPAEARERLRAWAKENLPWGDARIGTRWCECRDWHRSNGVLRSDWEAAFRNWLRKELDFQGKGRSYGRPQDSDLYREARGRRPVARSHVLGPSPLRGELGKVLELFQVDPDEGEEKEG